MDFDWSKWLFYSLSHYLLRLAMLSKVFPRDMGLNMVSPLLHRFSMSSLDLAAPLLDHRINVKSEAELKEEAEIAGFAFASFQL